MEEKGMYGILALVAVFAAAGIFLAVSNDGPQVVYVETGAQAAAQVPVQASIPARIMSAPFRVLGRGITGAVEYQVGNATTNFTSTIDLIMNKSVIGCSAQITSGASSAYLNTCNDNGGSGGTPTSGGTITCDGGTDKSDAANISTCDGGFLLTNNGIEAKLNAQLNESSGPFNSLYTYIYNINGCNASCSVADPGSLVTLSGSDQSLCDNMTSAGAVCQCIGISITSLPNLAAAKAGTPITFKKRDTLATPASVC